MNLDHVIMYLRKSRSDNADLSLQEVLARHERQLQEFAGKEYGVPLPESQIYREVVSGETIADRPVMSAIMSLLETGGVQGVLVIEPQRLSRGDMEDCGHLINVFRYTDTKVITPAKIYDLTEEYDRKFFEMELTRGNDYLEYTKRILNRGRIRSVKEGNFIGSIPPYGYEKVKVGTGKDGYHTLRIIPEEASTLRLMYELYVYKGYGYAKIAKHLDLLGIKPRKARYWSPSAIRDFLTNPVYIGKIRWNRRKTKKTIAQGKVAKQRPNSPEKDWIIADGRHPPIIDQEIFYAAQERIGNTPCVRKHKEIMNPFAGLLFCGSCGHAMSYKRSFRGKSNVLNESMVCNCQSACHTKSVQYAALCERIYKLLEQTMENLAINRADHAEKEFAPQEKIIETLELQLGKLKEKDARQKDAFDDGIYTKEEYLSRNARVQSQIAEKEKAIEDARSFCLPATAPQKPMIYLADCLHALRNPALPAAEKNLFLKNCIQRIDYFNTQPSQPGIGRHVANIFELHVKMKL